jgi:hypothetical protein
MESAVEAPFRGLLIGLPIGLALWLLLVLALWA